MLKRSFVLFGATALLCVFFVGCGFSRARRPAEIASTVRQLAGPQDGDSVAVIDTDRGVIRAVLFPSLAPKAVENFVALAKEGYYDGVTFHRVVEDFIIQSGDPTGTGTGGESIWGEPFACEYSEELHNYSGALAMANSGADQNGSQFYFVSTPANSVSEALAQKMLSSGFDREVVKAYREVGGAPYLDCKYTVFGQVYSGMEAVDEINTADTTGERPKKEIVIRSITIEPFSK